MSIATLAGNGIFAPLQGLWQWFNPPAKRSHLAMARSQLPPCPMPVHSTPSRPPVATLPPHPGHRFAMRRPLRVLRVVESGLPSAHVGRMLISGRMADVCAELDRLAAAEAMFH